MQLPSFIAQRFAALAPGTWFWMQEKTSGARRFAGIRLELAESGTSVSAAVFVPEEGSPTCLIEPELQADVVALPGDVRLDVEPGLVLFGNEANAARPGTLLLVDDRWFVAVQPRGGDMENLYMELRPGPARLLRRLPPGVLAAFPQWRLTRVADGAPILRRQ